MTIEFETTEAAVFTASGDWTGVPDHVTAWVGSNFLGEVAITEPETLERNDTYTIAAGLKIPFNITPTGGSVGQADAGFLAVLADTQDITLALHDGDPGNAHDQNELAAGNAAGYARATVAARVEAA